MIKEVYVEEKDKELLLKDLCARLPYRVKGIITFDESNTTFTVEGIDNNVLHLSDAEECYVEDFKPYLRPMSSMTEEERKMLWELLKTLGCTADVKRLDWLTKSKFDYRGLIEKGLAIKVTEENNPYKS